MDILQHVQLTIKQFQYQSGIHSYHASLAGRDEDDSGFLELLHDHSAERRCVSDTLDMMLATQDDDASLLQSGQVDHFDEFANRWERLSPDADLIQMSLACRAGGPNSHAVSVAPKSGPTRARGASAPPLGTRYFDLASHLQM